MFKVLAMGGARLVTSQLTGKHSSWDLWVRVTVRNLKSRALRQDGSHLSSNSGWKVESRAGLAITTEGPSLPCFRVLSSLFNFPQCSTTAAEAPDFISTFHHCGIEKPPSHLACPQPPSQLSTSHSSHAPYPGKAKVGLPTRAR